MTICIYCRSSSNSFLGREHVIPQAFGAFGTATPTLKCVCDVCNSFFGNGMDVNLARHSIEGLTRHALGIFSKADRPTNKVDVRLGAEAGELAGIKVDIIGKTGQPAPLRAQLLAFNHRTKNKDVFFLEDIIGMTLPTEIYGGPKDEGHLEVRQLSIWAMSEEEYAQLAIAIGAAGIVHDFGQSTERPLPAGRTEDGTIELEMEQEVDESLRRAFAKICFNFLAWNLGTDEALLAKWDFVREYVRYGKGLIRWRPRMRPFWPGIEFQTDEELGVLPSTSIDIQIMNHKGNVVGALRFYSRQVYELILTEGVQLAPGQERAYRFTPGYAPFIGIEGPKGLIPDISS